MYSREIPIINLVHILIFQSKNKIVIVIREFKAKQLQLCHKGFALMGIHQQCDNAIDKLV